MILLRLEGGIGNQFFQYARATSLQSRIGGKIFIDNKSVKSEFINIHSLGLANVAFPNKFERIILFGIRMFYILLEKSLVSLLFAGDTLSWCLQFLGYYRQFGTRYTPDLVRPLLPIVYIRGNWMSERYFTDVSVTVRELLVESIVSSVSNKISAYANSIEGDVCAVHIRRGDYLSSRWANDLSVCHESYYVDAVNEVRRLNPNMRFLVFSNSPEEINWIQNNYSLGPNVEYQDMAVSGLEDFYLMSRCKSFILSNSTFSWWASYLSSSTDGIVVAPSKWNNGAWDMQDIYMDNWIVRNV